MNDVTEGVNILLRQVLLEGWVIHSRAFLGKTLEYLEQSLRAHKSHGIIHGRQLFIMIYEAPQDVGEVVA